MAEFDLVWERTALESLWTERSSLAETRVLGARYASAHAIVNAQAHLGIGPIRLDLRTRGGLYMESLKVTSLRGGLPTIRSMRSSWITAGARVRVGIDSGRMTGYDAAGAAQSGLSLMLLTGPAFCQDPSLGTAARAGSDALGLGLPIAEWTVRRNLAIAPMASKALRVTSSVTGAAGAIVWTNDLRTARGSEVGEVLAWNPLPVVGLVTGPTYEFSRLALSYSRSRELENLRRNTEDLRYNLQNAVRQLQGLSGPIEIPPYTPDQAAMRRSFPVDPLRLHKLIWSIPEERLMRWRNGLDAERLGMIAYGTNLYDPTYAQQRLAQLLRSHQRTSRRLAAKQAVMQTGSATEREFAMLTMAITQMEYYGYSRADRRRYAALVAASLAPYVAATWVSERRPSNEEIARGLKRYLLWGSGQTKVNPSGNVSKAIRTHLARAGLVPERYVGARRRIGSATMDSRSRALMIARRTGHLPSPSVATSRTSYDRILPSYSASGATTPTRNTDAGYSRQLLM